MAQPNLKGFGVPVFKTWGRRHHLSCVSPHKERVAPATAAVWDVDRDPDARKPSPPLQDGFERIRMKLMAHLRDAADKFNLAVPQQPEETDGVGDGDANVKAELRPPALAKRLRQRRRRDADNPPSRAPSPSPPPPATTRTRSLRPRSAARAEKEQRRDRKFSVCLSREEIDEDFYAFTGRRASGRPKRRPRAVRKNLDLLFPGLGLSEITAGCYEVTAPRVQSRGA